MEKSLGNKRRRLVDPSDKAKDPNHIGDITKILGNFKHGETRIFTEEDAEWFRFWGERGVEHVLLREPPFDRDWSGWRPDPAWRDVDLPHGWETVPV